MQPNKLLQRKVHIGISIYKQKEEHVLSCVMSALNQTHENTIISIRFDGVDAAKPELVHKLQLLSLNEHRLIIDIGQENLGTFGSYRRIFEASTSQYICQLDADDLLDKKAIELSLLVLEGEPNVAMVYSDCTQIDEDGSMLGLRKENQLELTPTSLLVSFISYHLRVIRKSFYLKAGEYDPFYRYAGDYDLSLKLQEIGLLAYIPRPLYIYRVHNQSSSQMNKFLTNSEALIASQNALMRRGLSNSCEISLDSMTGSLSLVIN
jgi:GT2 family glycosyltransferase